MDKSDQKIINFPKPKDLCVPTSRGGKNRRVSDRLLTQLRNKIPIRDLIQKELGLEHHMDAGIFRFKCPHCNSFHASAQKKTNLARCFDCEINFNPIDMVMTVKKLSFRQSVTFLSDLLGSPSQKQRENCGSKTPETIGEVFSVSKISSALPDQKKEDARLSHLEKEIEGMKRQMKQLHQFITNEISEQNSRSK